MDAHEAAAANAHTKTHSQSTTEAEANGAERTTVPEVKASRPNRRQKKEQPQLEVVPVGSAVA
jgi:hypothetical protein